LLTQIRYLKILGNKWVVQELKQQIDKCGALDPSEAFFCLPYPAVLFSPAAPA